MLAKRKRLPAIDAVRVVHQALLGLQHIHEKGLIHRDLEPANLMLVGDEAHPTVKILDIGLGKAVFDEHAVNIGELFSVPAAIAVQNALVLAQAKRLATNLQAALVSRAVIDQAMGIVMSRTGCNAAEAFDRLRARSQTEHVKVSAVAQSVVDAAVRRARARRAIEDPPAG